MKSVIVLLLVMLSNPVSGIELHTGLNGPWHQAENPGQGLVLHIIPESNQVFIAWFTYTETGGQQRWLTAHGNLDDQVIELTIYESTNGKLNSAQPSPEQHIWGSGSLSFVSCQAATFTFQNNDGQSGQMSLSRVTAPINCSEV